MLTQREIDSLLNAPVVEGENREAAATPSLTASRGYQKTVKQYDFRRPDKFSKEQLRSLQTLHENFARQAASILSNRLRCNVEMKLSSIDQGIYEEYVAQVVPPSFVQTLQMAPLGGSVVIEYGRDVGMVIFDRLLGGSGAAVNEAHEVTDVELQLLRGIATTLSEALQEAWSNLAAVQPEVTEVMEDIQLAQIAPPSEVVIAVMLEISVLDMVGALSVCTPFSVLEDVLPRLTAQAWVGTGRKLGRANVVEDLRAQIERATVPVSAEVGSTTVRAQDVAALSVGDVIRLDSPASRTINPTSKRSRSRSRRPASG